MGISCEHPPPFSPSLPIKKAKKKRKEKKRRKLKPRILRK